jgi:hypothetical protein
MGLFGSLLAAPIRLMNAPIRAMETIVGVDEDDRVLSKPLDALAHEVKKVDDDD